MTFLWCLAILFIVGSFWRREEHDSFGEMIFAFVASGIAIVAAVLTIISQ